MALTVGFLYKFPDSAKAEFVEVENVIRLIKLLGHKRADIVRQAVVFLGTIAEKIDITALPESKRTMSLCIKQAESKQPESKVDGMRLVSSLILNGMP